MAVGADSQIGYAVETTPGTYETVTDFFEFVPPLGLRKIPTRAKSRAIRAGRRMPHHIAVGPYTVVGPVTHELVAETTGTLLRAMIEGTPATTGSNPYTHVFDGSTEISSLSAQIALPSAAANHPIAFAGLRCRQWTLNLRPGDVYPTLTLDWLGKTADIDGTPALATASYAAFTRFVFSHATLLIAGSEVCVDNIQLQGTTGWAGEHKICSTDAGSQALFRGGKAMVTGSFVTDLAGLTQLNRLIDGTQVAFSLAFNAGASAQLTFTGNIDFSGDMATVQNEGKTKETVNFEFVHGTSDASAFTATLINADATA